MLYVGKGSYNFDGHRYFEVLDLVLEEEGALIGMSIDVNNHLGSGDILGILKTATSRKPVPGAEDAIFFQKRNRIGSVVDINYSLRRDENVEHMGRYKGFWIYEGPRAPPRREERLDLAQVDLRPYEQDMLKPEPLRREVQSFAEGAD